MSDKKFGLIIPKKADKFKIRANPIFDDESDEDQKQRKRPKIPQKKIDFKSKVKQESLEDPSIYEYDSIYDEMKAKKVESLAPKEKKNSRYIDTLLKAADKRKKEYERRIDKKIQAEREKEGDQFKDKEAFVTSSYKKKLQEKEEEEERERRENMLNDMMDITKQKDLSGFYRHFLKQTVGEERIPVFGEKHIRQEVTDSKKDNSPIRVTENIGEKHIKQEVIDSMEDNSPNRVTENIKDNMTLDHASIDQDSDGIEIDSDSEDKKSDTSDEETSSKKQANEHISENVDGEEKIKKSKAKSHSIFKDKSKFSPKGKNPKTHIRKNSNVSRSDSESNSNEDAIDHKKGSHSGVHGSKETNIHRSRHDSSSDDNEIDKKSDEPKEQDKIVKKDKASIYAKRTVGDIFVAAQARYFQRMALKNEK